MKDFITVFFKNSLNNNNIRHHSRNTNAGVVIAKRFNFTFRNLLKRVVFEKSDRTWFKILPIITKQCYNTIHSSTNLTPIQAGLKKIEEYVYKKLLDN